MNDLTTLRDAKNWMGITSDTDDARIQALVRQISAFVLSYIQRSVIFRKQVIETFSGNGGSAKMLRNYPVIGVNAVIADGRAVPPSGYWLDPDDGVPPGRLQAIKLNGYAFPRAPCSITYTVGYFIAGEPQIAAESVFVDGPYGAWMVNGAVTYADGRPMAQVLASPAQGQYALGDRGEYQFSDGDAGVPVLISYSYVPAQLEQACLEIIAERYAYRERVGQSSINVSGAVSAYRLTDMPDYIRTSLDLFRNRVPV